jgi:hypothetical protein
MEVLLASNMSLGKSLETSVPVWVLKVDGVVAICSAAVEESAMRL